MANKRNEIYKIFRALGDPNRLKMALFIYEKGERTVTELINISGLSQSAVSQHLALMREYGILKTRKEGLYVFYSINHFVIDEILALAKLIIDEEIDWIWEA